MDNFEFKLGQKVLLLKKDGKAGVVKARADYINSDSSYYVAYTDDDTGCEEGSWVDSSNIRNW